MKRAAVPSILVVVVLLALGVIAEAQQPKKVFRIGYLSSADAARDSARSDAIRLALRELGYVEGQNIVIEYRYADGKFDRLPDLADELIHLKIDAIVAAGASATAAVKNVTNVIPIVMTNVSDPVGLGIVVSLARPGGNITGLTGLQPELGGKRLELLKEILPKLSRVAVLADPSSQVYGPQIKEIQVAAPALNLQLQTVEVREVDDLENAFLAMTKARAGALIVLAQPTLNNMKERIVGLASKSRLPTIYGNVEFVDAGGLMSYATNVFDLDRRAAVYVDKILKGTKPADLPVEQPIKFEFIINLKAAKQIGLTIPPNVLVRADRVIK
jgi:putative tryptophan/tyrosine transport system substrate-binding protein